MNVAVTGANGFIGRHVLRQLTTDGGRVRGIGRSARPTGTVCDNWAMIRDYERGGDELRGVFHGMDAVVHLAAVVHAPDGRGRDPFDINVAIARSVFEAAAAAGVKTFIHMSSIAAVCGESASVVDDKTPRGPTTAYGQSKRDVEDFLAGAAGRHEIAVVNLRPPTVYGPGMRGKPLFLFKSIARSVPLPLGGFDNKRSFMFVGNLATAVSRLLTATPVTQSFVLSDSDPLSTADFARHVGAAIGRPPIIVDIPQAYVSLVDTLARVAPWVRFPLDAESIASLRSSLAIDSSRFWRVVGMQPPVSLDDGLEQTARWFTTGRVMNAAG